jgi:adenosylhomocysteinase
MRGFRRPYAGVVRDPRRSAERLIRRFARDTNLLVAGRAFRVVGEGLVSSILRHMLEDLGARVVVDSPRGRSAIEGEPSTVTIDVSTGDILLGATRLPARRDVDERIDRAAEHMPVSGILARELGSSGLVRGVRIGIAMVLEPKTAQLALLLQAAGAAVAVYAHPDEFDEQIAAALRARGVPVDGSDSLAGAAERAAATAFLRRGFDLLLDDGSHLIRLAHEEGLAGDLIGAAEETTSGLAPLRLMAESGILRLPVIAVNDARTKTDVDNRYGTGQSCVFAIAEVLDAVGLTVRDQPALVIGYGPVGEGVAAHLRALGAEVAVAETDPFRALRAVHDGYRVGHLHDLAPHALVVSATGAPHTVDADILRVARIVAVAGGVPNEVDLDPVALVPVRTRGHSVAHLERYGPDGALVIDRGGCVNLTAGEGNPIEVMDLSFAVQLGAVTALMAARGEGSAPLAPGIHPLSPAVDARIAALALAERGASHDIRSTSQLTAEGDWRSPRFRPAAAEAS